MRRGGGTGAGIVPSAPGIVRARPGGLVCAPPLRAPCTPRARARLLLAADAPRRAAAPPSVAEIPDLVTLSSPWDERSPDTVQGPKWDPRIAGEPLQQLLRGSAPAGGPAWANGWIWSIELRSLVSSDAARLSKGALGQVRLCSQGTGEPQ